MLRSRIYELRAGIEENSKYKVNAGKFNLMLVKNNKIIKQEIKDVEDAFPESDDFKEYSNKRNNIAFKHGKKKDDGSLDIEKKGAIMVVLFDTPEIEKLCQTELDELAEEYKETIEERNKQLDEMDSLLLEEIEDVKWTTVDENSIPSDAEFDKLQLIEEFLE